MVSCGRVPPARLVIASLAAVIAASHHASAASGRNERSVESVQSRNAGEPIMAVVSLRNQRITVYDAKMVASPPTEANFFPVVCAALLVLLRVKLRQKRENRLRQIR
jgi:hypothetical protein